MPLSMPCSDLTPGMKLASSFLHRGTLMLPAGKMLEARDIAALQRRFPSMTFLVGDPILDDFVEFQDDSRDREIANVAQGQISNCMAEVHRKHSISTSIGGGSIDFSLAKAAVNEVMQFLKDNPVSTAILTRCFDGSTYLAAHAGNVFYLSMLLASAVKGYIARERQRLTVAQLQPKQLDDLMPLGVGAMFADVGLAPLAMLFGEDHQLTEAERKIVLDHPNGGAELLPERFPPLAKMIVRTHHENFDGSGYPGRAGGQSLNVFSRIVRIADAFDASTSEVFSQAQSPTRSLWEMSVGPHHQMYDPVLMTVFRTIIQPFPIGAKLQLTDGRYAVVTKHNRDFPFDPHVIVAFNSKGQRLRDLEPPMQLSEGGLTAKSFRGEDLTYLQYEDSDAPCSAPTKFRTLFDAFYP